MKGHCDISEQIILTFIPKLRQLTFYTIIIYCLIFFFFACRPFKRGELSRWTWPGVFSIHVLVGIVFLYIYTFIEGNGVLSQDAGAYFFESAVLNEVFWQSPADYFQLLFGLGDTKVLTQQYLLETNHWDVGSQAISNESRNMIRLHSVLHFLSFKLPEVHMLFMALISTASGYFFYRAIESKTELNRYMTIVLISFLPNTLFWSSGLIKEPVYIFGFSLITYALFAQIKYRSHWFAFIIGVLILMLFKFHFLIILLAGMAVWRISKLFGKNKVLLTGLTVFTVTALILSIFGSARSELTNSISRKQFDFKNISRGGVHLDNGNSFYFFNEVQLDNLLFDTDSAVVIKETEALRLNYTHKGAPDTVKLTPTLEKWKIHFMRPKSNSYFELTDLDFNFFQLIKVTPEALLNSFFRPFITENGGALKWVSVIELFVVWFLFLFSFKWIKNSPSHYIEFYLLLGTIIILSALLIGWTTPVSGAIVRYRIPIHLGMIIIAILNWKQKPRLNE